MAINPNTDFTTGAVYTADQANRFPRGVMALTTSTTTPAAITNTLSTMLTASTFTAVANRYYKITYYEPIITHASGALTFVQGQLKNGGTTLAFGTGYMETNRCEVLVCAVTTFAAGSVTLTAEMSTNTGTATANRSATGPAFILVEDIGPA
jgi:hypothetical protein